MKDSTAQLAQEIGDMLAKSPLDPTLKKFFLDHLDTMPENLVFKLKDMLEKEDAALDSFGAQLESYLANQEHGWLEVEAQQQKKATEITDQLFDKLKDNL